MAYINPKWIICDFLRNYLKDPRSTRKYILNSNTHIANVGDTIFAMSPSSGTKLSHVTSVTVNGTTKKKWGDYHIDFRDEKIILFTSLSAGDIFIVNYGETSSGNWIFWDKPDVAIDELSFPRLSVSIVAGSGKRLGEFEAPVESVVQFQVDVWCKEKAKNQIFDIGGRKYTGEDLAEYLSYQVMQAFEDHENALHPVMYDYVPTQIPPRTLPFDEQYQAHHKEVDFILKGIKLGRTS